MRSNYTSFLTSVVLVLAACLVSGCGTLLYSQNDELFVDSRPAEAEVVYNGRLVGQTPMTLQVVPDRTELHQIVLRKQGYEPHTCFATPKLNKKVLLLDGIPAALAMLTPFMGLYGIFVVGPALGTVSAAAYGVDYFTDNMWYWHDNTCSVDLFKIEE